MKRLRVGIIFGGRSVEHEVSLVSARSVLSAIDPARYEVVPIGVTKTGKWLTSSRVAAFLDAGAVGGEGEHAALIADPSVTGLVRVGGAPVSVQREAELVQRLDVVFPLIHGGYGEDGKLQGLLEMADLPYVGSGVLGSAIGMDKDVSKRLLRAAGVPVVDGIVIRRSDWKTAPAAGQAEARARIESGIGYPCFVKPACQGSSVGVSRARSWDATREAIDEALTYDDKVLVEKAIDAREIEVAVLGNDDPQASVPGEIVTSGHEFYDYDAKYHDQGTQLLIPADVPPAQAQRLRDLAVQAFRALELSGMARVDYLVERTTGEAYLNEVNTLPGFTPVSMYPKLWEATGVRYPQLVDRLIGLALDRHAAKHRLRTTKDDAGSVSAAPKGRSHA